MSYDAVVVGGGPAGVAAAIELARHKLATALLEPLAIGGEVMNVGEMTDALARPSRSGADVAAELTEQVMEQPVNLMLGEAATALVARGDGWEVRTHGGQLDTRSVILATGTTPIGLADRPDPHEDELVGRGLLTCADCDAPLYGGKRVVVAGGGDTGAEAALAFGTFADEVTLVERRQELTCHPATASAVAETPNVVVRMGTSVERLLKGGDAVAGVVAAGAAGEMELPADGVMLALGRRPVTAFVDTAVELDRRGAVATRPDLGTSARGVFAAGDVRSCAAGRYEAAIGDGVSAALSAATYLRGGG
jgi:thioredoxin reductase